MMWYIEWYVSEGNRGVTRGRLAVYFRSKNAAYDAIRHYTEYRKVDGCDIKEKIA